ncbi:hypothetical protein BJY00DRAFT_293753 [Aspergillus carlsbadensis]|nr:hypothetical protein BJY00DRAFT_293753 [Aspergillus carlsbadensis]
MRIAFTCSPPGVPPNRELLPADRHEFKRSDLESTPKPQSKSSPTIQTDSPPSPPRIPTTYCSCCFCSYCLCPRHIPPRYYSCIHMSPILIMYPLGLFALYRLHMW